jgi:hypothetical protein
VLFYREISDPTWHSSPSCSQWPTGKFNATNTLPPEGSWCVECQRLARATTATMVQDLVIDEDNLSTFRRLLSTRWGE